MNIVNFLTKKLDTDNITTIGLLFSQIQEKFEQDLFLVDETFSIDSGIATTLTGKVYFLDGEENVKKKEEYVGGDKVLAVWKDEVSITLYSTFKSLIELSFENQRNSDLASFNEGEFSESYKEVDLDKLEDAYEAAIKTFTRLGIKEKESEEIEEEGDSLFINMYSLNG